MKPNYIFDQEEFYVRLDKVRRCKNISWYKMSLETGVEKSTLLRLGQGSSVSPDALGTLVKWAGLNWEDLFKKRELDPTTITQVSHQIETDGKLSEKEKEFLVDALNRLHKAISKGSFTNV